MNKIIEYQILTSTDADALQEKVNDSLKDGFQPFGSVAVTYSADEEKERLYQPVVKYENGSS